MARALARNGATVYILDRDQSKLGTAAGPDAEYAEGKIVGVECDVTSKASLEKAAARVDSEIGFVNILVANAGINGPRNDVLLPRQEGDERGPLNIHDVKEHLWQLPLEGMIDVYRVNVTGALFTAVAFLELLDRGNAADSEQPGAHDECVPSRLARDGSGICNQQGSPNTHGKRSG